MYVKQNRGNPFSGVSFTRFSSARPLLSTTISLVSPYPFHPLRRGELNRENTMDPSSPVPDDSAPIHTSAAASAQSSTPKFSNGLLV
jgi:hypothetical protein